MEVVELTMPCRQLRLPGHGEDKPEAVGELLDGVDGHVLLVDEHRVLGHFRCALEGEVTVQEELRKGRTREALVHHQTRRHVLLCRIRASSLLKMNLTRDRTSG